MSTGDVAADRVDVQEPAPDEQSVRSVFDRRYKALSLGVIIIVSVVAFESLGVATVLPVAARELDGLGSYGWGLAALMLANIVGAVVAGRVADRQGPWLPFAVAVAVFLVGCLIAAAGPTWFLFLVGRAVQGLGVGAVMGLAFMAIGTTYPDHLQPRMYALLSSAWTIPALIGPVIGGLVSDTIGWRWVFVIITPFALVAGLLATLALKRLVTHTPTQQPASGGWRNSVILNSLLLVAGTAVVLLALETEAIATLVVGIVIGLVVAAIGLRRVTPTGTLVARRGVAAGIVVRGLLCGAYFGTEAFLPLGLSELRGVGTTASGIGLAVGALTWVGGSFLQAKIDGGGNSDRAKATSLGSLILAAGSVMVGLAILVPGVPAFIAIVGWAVGGLGMGIAINASTSETMRLSSRESLGLTSSSLQLAQTLATAVLAGLGGGLIHLAVAYGGTTALALTITFAITTLVGLASVVVAGRLQMSSEDAVTSNA